MYSVYQCDPYFGGCGFQSDQDEQCPQCNGALDIKYCCLHPEFGCGHIKEPVQEPVYTRRYY